jgi:hypothetical protein
MGDFGTVYGSKPPGAFVCPDLGDCLPVLRSRWHEGQWLVGSSRVE